MLPVTENHMSEENGHDTLSHIESPHLSKLHFHFFALTFIFCAQLLLELGAAWPRAYFSCLQTLLLCEIEEIVMA